MLAAIADGESHLTGYAPGADCAATLACLEALGVRIARAGGAITIEGLGLGGLRAPAGPLDAANSGTSMRLFAGLLAAHPFRTVIGGDASLSNRPMRRVIEPLIRMGAAIGSVDGRPPLTIDGTKLHGIAYTPEVPSAQVKSAVLLAGLHAEGRTTVVERSPTRDHTERALNAFGVPVARANGAASIDGGRRLHAIDAPIPGDISSAVFWLALAAGTPGSDLFIDGVGLNRSRSSVLDVLRRAGAEIELLGGPPAGGDADAAGDHRLAMAFAIAGCRARGVVHIAGADAVAVSYPGFFDELERIARAT
jgi:3-phosphoshikimate 1-carboxyvinyltransferase